MHFVVFSTSGETFGKPVTEAFFRGLGMMIVTTSVNIIMAHKEAKVRFVA